MVNTCAAPGCSDHFNKGSEISFHCFPLDKSLRRKWVLATKRKFFIPTQASRLCGKHFLPTDYESTFDRVTLKSGTVPSIFNFPVNLKKKVIKPRRHIEFVAVDQTEFDSENSLSKEFNSAEQACIIYENKMKEELVNPHLEEDIVKKHSFNKPLCLEVKTEMPDIKYELTDGGGDVTTIQENLAHEELIIKEEASESIFQEQHINKSNLKEQLNTSTNDSFQCNNKSSCKPTLQKHVNLHSDENRYLCSICNGNYMHKRSLKRHMKKHAVENPFNCTECTYKCRNKTELQQHIIKIHTGEKPFYCNLCDYKCVTKYILRRHNMVLHMGEKSLNCSKCNYKCLYKSHLQQHMFKHTVEKPFNCNFCDYKCKLKSNFFKHLKKHKGENTFNCTPYKIDTIA